MIYDWTTDPEMKPRQFRRTLTDMLRVVIGGTLIGACGYTTGSLAGAGAAPEVVYIDRPAVVSEPAVRVTAPPVLPRVLLAGDSTAVNAYDSWWARTDVTMVRVPESLAGFVSDPRGAARLGCPLVRKATGYQSKFGTGNDCDWSTWLPQTVAATHPDVVVVSFGWFIAWDYTTDGQDRYRVDDAHPEFTAVTEAEMSALERAVLPARVLWLTYPATNSTESGMESVTDSERVEAMWAQLRGDRERAKVMGGLPSCWADLGWWVRGHVSGDGMFRDGQHFTEAVQDAATAWVAEQVTACRG